jgi:5-methyltetrahydropteroyltriglutamate--homocysteine methyltransferase
VIDIVFKARPSAIALEAANPRHAHEWKLFETVKLPEGKMLMAGSDCGFGTWVGQAAVDPDVVWAKMAAMAEGARIASREFWKG